MLARIIGCAASAAGRTTVKRGWLPAYIGLFILSVAGCAGSGGARVAAPGTAARSAAAPAIRRILAVNPSPAAQLLCIGAMQYRTIQDDEFDHDNVLNYTTDFIMSTPAPNGAMWSSKALGFTNGGTRNNIGIDDAFYTNPSIAPGFDPFSISGGALNIETEPIPAPEATATTYDGAHWLSGVLEGPAQTYGYLEVSAKIPNLQGYWPAPLWLLGLAGADGKGNGYEELDASELFGNSLGKSVIQQTQIASLTGTPPSNYVRGFLSPDPSAAYHTYGVLWTPATVNYYVDRKPTSPAYPNAAFGPANPLIILQVYAAGYGGAAPPAKKTPQTMHLQYYRWYQSTSAACSPSVLKTPSPVYPTPTPAPVTTPVAGAPAIVQTGTMNYPAPSTMLATFPNVPRSGDLLFAVLIAANPVTVPAGWAQVDGSSSGTGFLMYAGAVGSNGLSPTRSYSFGTNSGDIELLDIAGASTSTPGIVGVDPTYQYLSNVPRSLTIPQARGLLLSIWAGYSSLNNGFKALGEILPVGQIENPFTYRLNDPIASGGSISLRVSQVLHEPFTAPQPYTIDGTSAVFGNWAFDGDLIWIYPAQ